MSMTPAETTKVQAAFAELRAQRDMAFDRCANLIQEIAVRDHRISELESMVANLSKQLSPAADQAA